MALHRIPFLAVLALTWLGIAGLALGAHGVVAWRSALVGISFALPVVLLLTRYLRANPADEIAAFEGRAREGTITMAIPPRGIGRVRFTAQGKRLSRPARTSDGTALATGRSVLIVSLRRHVAVVEPLPVR